MKKIVFLLGVFLAWVGCFAFPDVLIIANPDTPVSSLKKKEIKDIFTGKMTRWNSSGKIIIATLKDSELHREFLRQYVKKTPSQFKNYWRRKVFTGEGRLPKIFKTEAGLIDFVASTKGAVGYISSTTRKPVKIIEISDRKGGGR
jgi:ABC-type phosphate transport system substrate-binding protein